MNGIEHYKKAEALLVEAEGEPSTRKDRAIATAQVHATLALVSAQVATRYIDSTRHDGEDRIEYVDNQWLEVTE